MVVEKGKRPRSPTPFEKPFTTNVDEESEDSDGDINMKQIVKSSSSKTTKKSKKEQVENVTIVFAGDASNAAGRKLRRLDGT